MENVVKYFKMLLFLFVVELRWADGKITNEEIGMF